MSFRSQIRPYKLTADQDIFHHFQWPQSNLKREDGPAKVGGRPRFIWTAQLSLHLIMLIIHTDMKFDDIAAALKDANGKGPCKTTWRNHWHEIFQYDPSVARISDFATQTRRRAIQVAAYRRCQIHESHSYASRETQLPTQLPQAPSWSLTSLTSQYNTDELMEEVEDSKIYSPSFVSWFKQAGLQIGRPEAAYSQSTGTVQYSRDFDNTTDHKPEGTICSILESHRATDDDLPSITAVVEQLLRGGANPNETNERGERLLHLAVALGHIPIVTLLLEYGADTHTKTNAGESVWQFGARASQELMRANLNEIEEPDLLRRTMACGRVEFARSTVEFNTALVVKGRSTREDRSFQRYEAHQFPGSMWPEAMDQHAMTQPVMVNAAIDGGNSWGQPEQFSDLFFLSGAFQSDQPMFEQEPDRPWQ